MNIFEIAQELEKVFLDLEESEGELTPELESRLATYEIALDDKFDGYAYFINKQKSEHKMLSDRIEQLKAKQESIENRIKHVKENVLLPLVKGFGEKTKSGGWRYKTAENTFYTQKTKSVDVDEIFFDDERFINHNLLFKNIDNDTKTKIEQLIKKEKEILNVEGQDTPKIDKKSLKEFIELYNQLDEETRKQYKPVKYAEIVEKIGLRIR